jgi:DNA-binding NarL/FixJ family response regulator
MTVRVVVADDHAIVREGLQAVLSTRPGYELVEAVATGPEAVRSAVTTRPDVVVMDVQLPGGGIEATREITRAAPQVAVIILTMFDDDEFVFAAMRAGARGYVLKGASPDSIVRAIAAAAAGEAIFGTGISQRALDHLSDDRRDTAPAFPELTPREREVLDLMASGLGNAAIAARLGLAGATVANHVSNIFGKLQVGSRSEAIVLARRSGLGAEPGAPGAPRRM